MKISILSHYAPGLLNFRGPLITDLLAHGIKVKVLSPDWTPDLRQQLLDMGAPPVDMPLSRVGLNPLHDLQTLLFLWRWLRVERPDVVLSYAAKTNVWGMIAAALAGVPHRVAMVEGMGYAFTDRKDGKRTFRQRVLGGVLAQLYRLAFTCAHRVLTLNPDDARDLQAVAGLRPEKTTILGAIGLPLEDWPLAPPQLQPVTFTLVARMLREKGVFEFLQAAEIIKVRHPATRFCLLGGLDANPGAIQASDLQPWVDRGVVEWPGQVQIQPWLVQTSVFVLPSYREGVPRSTQEAMAMGRPVITTDAPGCRETVVDGVNGFMLPPHDAAALVQAMLQFIERPELISRMGQESRRMAEERFDVRKVNQVMLQELGLTAVKMRVKNDSVINRC